MPEPANISGKGLTVVEFNGEPGKFAFERTVDEGGHGVIASLVACGSEDCGFRALLEGSAESEGDGFLLITLYGAV